MERGKNKLKIRILTTEPFPIGMAASNRIGTYAKGLSEFGNDVTVCILKPTELHAQVFNKEVSGQMNSYKFEYTGGKTILANNVFKRKFDDAVGMWKMCRTILKENKTDKTDAIIFYSPSTARVSILYAITRLKKIIFLKEESEFPFIYERNKSFFQKIAFRKIHYRLFDGYLFMTRKIIDYFLQEKKIKKPCLHVPMTVEYERFQKKENKISSPYIAYCGTLNNDKDGVDILIDAFAQVTNNYPLVHLYLIGESASQEEDKLYKQKVNEYSLNEKVHFTGRKPKDEIPSLLCNAILLVMPRPQSKQAEGGFPTKLGEYLSTGNPVITTAVGEIPDYLTDGQNAFIATPGSVDSLVQKINEVFKDIPASQTIAKKGKEVVMEHFDYKKQTARILSFIENLKKKSS